MKRILGKFSVIFALAAGLFFFESCQSPNFIWSTSSGIVTYNRHTGQFEMLWENELKPSVIIHDTVYVCPDSVYQEPLK